MKPQKQTILTTENNPGNCLTACIASIFNKDISEVPYFVAHSDYFAAMYNWFYFKGYRIYITNTPKINGYVIVFGKSPRSGTHAVIYKDGKPYFDPHPDNTFTLDVTDYLIIEPLQGQDNLYDYWDEKFIYSKP